MVAEAVEEGKTGTENVGCLPSSMTILAWMLCTVSK
jgi:hypothetical protein